MTDAELIALYRDIFAEITAKAIPVCAPTSDDPERVRHYIVPVGPIHRAAGKLNFQMFNGEAHLKAATEENRRLRRAQDEAITSALRQIDSWPADDAPPQS